jgi:hypothetical protein
MASLLLGAVGSAIGGAATAFTAFGSAVSWGAVGGAVGTAAGSIVDSLLISALMPGQSQSGPRLADLRVTSATEGAPIARVFGKMRLGGNLIWATDFKEKVNRDRVGGKGGGGAQVKTYTYSASFAVGLCEGPIAGIGRIWADGKLFKPKGTVYRIYLGTEDQEPDPFIEAKTGGSPAYRGLAYVVFENMALERYGNRIPQMQFEVLRPPEEVSSAETLLRAVTMIPGTGEYVYGTTAVTRGEAGNSVSENQNARQDVTDFLASLGDLEAIAPNCRSVSLVVSWFGTDLRCGDCQIRPGVDNAAKVATEVWRVNGVVRSGAYVVSQVSGGAAYGGTPSDHVIVAAIQELKARGFKVTLYPFILMDVPAGNTLPDPYSDNAADVGQSVYPWRGRITCSPAAGYAGTVDKTATAASQVTAFFGSAAASDFAVAGTAVAWTGGADWGLRRMILHYAHLCDAAGGVDAFLIGTELSSLTRIRSGAATYPAVTALQTLAADVRSILGAGTKISYAANWSEYFGHHPADGSDDVFFHLDPFWASSDVDFVGIDNYMPMSDWRDGAGHLDAASWASIYDQGYLQSHIEGGEGYDWFYASPSDRAAQVRTPITDGVAAKPWVFRFKDIRAWWTNAHYNRPGGAESGSPTAWVPQSKPVRFTEAGCPAVDKGSNQPNVFYDPKSSESALPYFSRGTPDDLIQRRYIEALYGYWNDTAKNPSSGVYSGRMIDTAELAIWTWDARPFPAFPALADVWSDADNWRLGHWLTGRLGAGNLAGVVREICLRCGIAAEHIDTSRLVGILSGYAIGGLESARASLAPLQKFYGFDAVESEGVIRFVSRGAAVAATILSDDMVTSDDSAEVISLTRGQETELPLAKKWRIINADEDYGGLTVEDRRATVDTSAIQAESFEISAAGYVADRNVRRSLREDWAGRETLAFRLPPSRLAIDATDVVAVQHDGRLIAAAVTSVADSDLRTLQARRVDASVYDLPVSVDRVVSSELTTGQGPALARILALPQLSESEDARSAYGAVYASPWWGAAVFQWSKATDAWLDVASQSVPASFGVLVSDLPPGPLHRWDNGNEIVVDLPTAALASLSDTAMLAGGNALAIETATGVWEIVQFGLAAVVAPGRWRLSRLLRGQFGTADAMGAPALAGAQVVLLDDGVIGLPLQVADIAADIGWRVVPYDAISGDGAITPIAFNHAGRGLRPFTPAQPRSVRQTDLSWSLSWLRRSRNPAADNWSLIEVPQDETSEIYRLEILSGASVVRGVDLTAVTAWSYSSAHQTADFGAAVTSFTWRVAQYGQLGLGPWTTTTI